MNREDDECYETINNKNKRNKNKHNKNKRNKNTIFCIAL